jgi:hypothetical protein
MKPIERTITLEDLIEGYPRSVEFMVGKGLPCFVCGEPSWGTFEEMARKKGVGEVEIDQLIEELSLFLKIDRSTTDHLT